MDKTKMHSWGYATRDGVRANASNYRNPNREISNGTSEFLRGKFTFFSAHATDAPQPYVCHFVSVVLNVQFG